MSRLSTFPRRPSSEQLCDLHVYKVPLDLWRAPLNNILNQSVTETVSLGIIRVPPDLTLLDIRTEIEKQLEDQAPKDYVFLRSVGRSITRVKTRQEYEWTAKHFLPPKHYAPELYLLEATPELRDALAISERSSQLSPISGPRGSPGARSYRDGYRYGHRQGYPDESRSYQRHGPDKTTPHHHYSPLPRIKPTTPSHSRQGSPDEAFLTEVHTHHTRVPDSDRNPNSYPPQDKLDYRAREEEEGEEEPYGSRSHRSYKQTSPRKQEADSRPPRHQPIGEFYDGGHSTDPSPPPLDHGSPRSPSPQRKGAGSKTYRGANGYEREAAYTNNTNEDSGVAGMSPDNQYKHRDRESYYQAADRSRDTRRYNRDDDEEEKRRLQERDRWANDQEERRRREEEEQERRRRGEEEEDRQREEARRRAEEEEEEERRRREEEDRRREEEDRRRDDEKRRREEEDDERREEERRREEEERRREEEERRRREEEEEDERRRREEEDRLKGGSDEDDNRYASPHSPSAELDGQRNTESARQQRKEEERKLLEELQGARDSRQNTEKNREELVKKAKTLQSKTQNRRNQARDVWKKRYFEEKKKTPPLEDQTNRLREELDALHRKMMAVLEGPREKNPKTGDNRPSQKNNYIIQCTRLQHDIDDMKRRVENAKMKLTAEMKLRTQADAELRAVRAEAIQKKITMRGQAFSVY